MKTVTPKQDQIERNWYIVDVSGKVLGRAATQIAALLRGKHKPYFTPHLDTGDFVVVINAEKVVITGNKAVSKLYSRFSGYPDGLTQLSFQRMMDKNPEDVIYKAVKGMLPKNALGRKIIKKLKVYAGEEHPHSAQKPQAYAI
ncbi:MAG: large subunit ribosomal protein [Candidatus Cloacimonadota bacterium]|jgi:large subunit ribosomal protein L13|nr:large subunit ribosomal protein [Candidatus Cloacimonadota bacterium]